MLQYTLEESRKSKLSLFQLCLLSACKGERNCAAVHACSAGGIPCQVHPLLLKWCLKFIENIYMSTLLAHYLN